MENGVTVLHSRAMHSTSSRLVMSRAGPLKHGNGCVETTTAVQPSLQSVRTKTYAFYSQYINRGLAGGYYRLTESKAFLRMINAITGVTIKPLYGQ